MVEADRSRKSSLMRKTEDPLMNAKLERLRDQMVAPKDYSPRTKDELKAVQKEAIDMLRGLLTK
jgi:hypothetical protein